MRRWIPITKWLPEYRRSWLRGDLVAGATVWAILIPSAMAYAGIVGVDPVVGLYTVPLALLLYAILGGSRLLVVGPDAGIAVLSAATIASVAVGGEYLALTIALALIVGGVYLVFYFLRMGWVADLIPDPVIKGFIEGLVWVTILKQVPNLLGFKLEGAHGGFFGTLAATIEAIPRAHGATGIVGVSSLVALLLVKRFAPRLPGFLLVLVASIILVGLLGLDGKGVAVVGEVKGDMWDFGLPTGLDLDQIIALVPGAVAIVVLGFTTSMGAAKRAAEQTGEMIDPNQELLANGASNLGAGLSGGYAVTGTLSKTAVAIQSGGKSQVGNLFAGVLGVLTLVFLLPFIANLAFGTLAVLIVVVMAELSDLRYFRTLWSVHRLEFVVGVAAFAGVLAIGVLPGVVIGVVLALVVLADHVRKPPTAVVGRIPSGAFVDVAQRDDAKEIPGMLIWRQYAPLVFLNARRLSTELRGLAHSREDIRVVVIDASATSGVDSTATTAFKAARDDLAAAGIALWVADIREASWQRIVATLKAADAPIPLVFDSLADAVTRYERLGANDGPSKG